MAFRFSYPNPDKNNTHPMAGFLSYGHMADPRPGGDMPGTQPLVEARQDAAVVTAAERIAAEGAPLIVASYAEVAATLHMPAEQLPLIGELALAGANQ
jgi:hypothetical protein